MPPISPLYVKMSRKRKVKRQIIINAAAKKEMPYILLLY
jgi:hypothetical protein